MTTSTDSRPPIPRSILLVVGLAAVVILVGGLRSISSSLGPLIISLILVVTVWPLRAWLIDKGLHRSLASVAVLLTTIAIIVFMVLALVWSGFELGKLVSSDSYQASLNHYIDVVQQKLEDLGVTQSATGDATRLLDIPKLIGRVGSLLQGVIGIGSLITVIIMGLIFMCGDAPSFTERLDDVRARRPLVVASMEDFAMRTRSYMMVATVFGGIVAVLDAFALWMLGIPLALVWGIVSFVTNYIPNIGFIIGVAPPAVLGLFEGGFSKMIAVIIVYSALNVIIQSLIQPRFVGDRVGLSTTLTFVSLIFWSYVFGAVGALMAVPLTLLAQALLVNADPELHWLRPLISLKRDEADPGPTREQAQRLAQETLDSTRPAVDP